MASWWNCPLVPRVLGDVECALHLTRVGGLQMWHLRVGGAHLPELRFCVSCLWGATPVTRATDNNKFCLGKAKGTLVAMATDVSQFDSKLFSAPSRPSHLALITTATIAPAPTAPCPHPRHTDCCRFLLSSSPSTPGLNAMGLQSCL